MARMQASNAETGEVPFLARFAVPRSEGEALPGSYDKALSMWMVETSQGRVPAIECRSGLAELTTKTKVENESDDTLPALGEITTKTATNTETDDQRLLAGASLELTTKTTAQLESDDTNPRGYGLW